MEAVKEAKAAIAAKAPTGKKKKFLNQVNPKSRPSNPYVRGRIFYSYGNQSENWKALTSQTLDCTLESLSPNLKTLSSKS